MRCVSYMRRDSYWRDECCDYHKPAKRKYGDYGYYDLDGDLIAQQRKHIRSYAAELGWEIDEEYIDIEGTAEYERLMKDCENGKYDRVITDSFFRFSGSMVEAKVTLQEIFIPVGIQVAVAQDKFCSATSTKNETASYFMKRKSNYVSEGTWLDKQNAGKEHPSERQKKPQAETRQIYNGPPLLGSRIHDGETGEVMRYYGVLEKAVLYRICDEKIIRWNVCCPTVQFDSILDLVLETLRREKAAAEWAKENIFSEAADKKKEELLAPLRIRAEEMVKETAVLLSRRMEQKRATEDPDAENLDAERLALVDEEFNAIMKEAGRIETAYSLSNSWIKRFAGMDIPAELSNWHVRTFIDDIRVYGMGSADKYRVEVTVRYDESRSLLPEEWYTEHIFWIENPSGSTAPANTVPKNTEAFGGREMKPDAQQGG